MVKLPRRIESTSIIRVFVTFKILAKYKLCIPLFWKQGLLLDCCGYNRRYMHVNYLNRYSIKYSKYPIKIFVDILWLSCSFLIKYYQVSLNVWYFFFLHLVWKRYRESSTDNEIKRKLKNGELPSPVYKHKNNSTLKILADTFFIANCVNLIKARSAKYRTNCAKFTIMHFILHRFYHKVCPWHIFE